MSQFVRDFYNNNAVREWERLDMLLCKIEFASTLRLIDEKICALGLNSELQKRKSAG
jgi:hypothetical protein